jgi:hypothetical protein
MTTIVTNRGGRRHQDSRGGVRGRPVAVEELGDQACLGLGELDERRLVRAWRARPRS